MYTTAKFFIAATILALGATAATAAGVVVDPTATDTAATTNWDGFYAGVFGGYAAGTMVTSDPVLHSFNRPLDYSGYLLGVQTGYNFTLGGPLVGGVSVDVAYNNGYASDDSYTPDLMWSGSATARVGVDIYNVVPYLVGGVAFARASNTDRHNGGPGVTDTQTHVGYTVGTGIEFPLAGNVSANVEVRHTDYGQKTYNLANQTYESLSDNSARVGLNYHFN
jgi:outer membrane immunogenic protein